MDGDIKVQKVKYLANSCSDIKCQNQNLNPGHQDTIAVLLAV